MWRGSLWGRVGQGEKAAAGHCGQRQSETEQQQEEVPGGGSGRVAMERRIKEAVSSGAVRCCGGHLGEGQAEKSEKDQEQLWSAALER